MRKKNLLCGIINTMPIDPVQNLASALQKSASSFGDVLGAVTTQLSQIQKNKLELEKIKLKAQEDRRTKSEEFAYDLSLEKIKSGLRSQEGKEDYVYDAALKEQQASYDLIKQEEKGEIDKKAADIKLKVDMFKDRAKTINDIYKNKFSTQTRQILGTPTAIIAPNEKGDMTLEWTGFNVNVEGSTPEESLTNYEVLASTLNPVITNDALSLLPTNLNRMVNGRDEVVIDGKTKVAHDLFIEEMTAITNDPVGNFELMQKYGSGQRAPMYKDGKDKELNDRNGLLSSLVKTQAYVNTTINSIKPKLGGSVAIGNIVSLSGLQNSIDAINKKLDTLPPTEEDNRDALLATIQTLNKAQANIYSIYYDAVAKGYLEDKGQPADITFRAGKTLEESFSVTTSGKSLDELGLNARLFNNALQKVKNN